MWFQNPRVFVRPSPPRRRRPHKLKIFAKNSFKIRPPEILLGMYLEVPLLGVRRALLIYLHQSLRHPLMQPINGLGATSGPNPFVDSEINLPESQRSARLNPASMRTSRSKLLARAVLKIFGGPEGTSSVYLRASWPFLRSNLLL